MGKHSDYTPEQRAEIVLALLQREEPGACSPAAIR
jgi:hypothetical protein